MEVESKGMESDVNNRSQVGLDGGNERKTEGDSKPTAERERDNHNSAESIRLVDRSTN